MHNIRADRLVVPHHRLGGEIKTAIFLWDSELYASLPSAL